MNKRILAVFFVAAVFLGMAACRKKDEKEALEGTISGESTVTTTEEALPGIVALEEAVEDPRTSNEKEYEMYEDPSPTLETVVTGNDTVNQVTKPATSTTKPGTSSTGSATTTKPTTSTSGSNSSITKPGTSSTGSTTTKPTTSTTNPTTPAIEPTTPSEKPTTNPTNPTEPKDENNSSTIPSGDVEMGVVDIGITEFERYHNMSGQEQLSFMQSFESVEEFFAWYNEAKADYDAANPGVEINGDTIDLGTITGK